MQTLDLLIGYVKSASAAALLMMMMMLLVENCSKNENKSNITDAMEIKINEILNSVCVCASYEQS